MKRIIFLYLLIFPLVTFSQLQILTVSPSDLIKGQSTFILIKTTTTRFDLYSPHISLGNGVDIQSIQILSPTMLSVEAFVQMSAATGPRDLQIDYRGEIFSHPDAVNLIAPNSALSLSIHLMPFEILHISDFDPLNPLWTPLLFHITFYNDLVSRNIKLRFLLKSLDYGEILLSERTYTNLQPNELISLTNRDFEDYYLNGQSDEFLDKSGETSLLPAGEYSFVIAAIDELDNILVIDNQNILIENNLANIDLIGPGNPMDVSPAEIQAGSPFFQWFSSGYSFDFRLVEVFPGQLAAEDVMTNYPVYTAKSIQENFLTYPAFAELLEEGKTYAWQITSYYLDALGQKSVLSEVYWFSILNTGNEFLHLEKLKIIPDKLILERNKSFHFKAVGIDRNGQEVPVNCDWEVLPLDMGWINSDGFFQAGNQPIPVQLKAHWGNLNADAIVIVVDEIANAEPDISAWIDRLFGVHLTKDLYLSLQTGEFSSLKGDNKLRTHLYESVDLDISSNGPIICETFPEYLLAEPNNILKAIGTINPKQDSILEKGKSYDAKLIADYDITYALQNKSTSATLVDSFKCGSCISNNEIDSFVVFNKMGRHIREISIHSIWAEIHSITRQGDSLICVSKSYPENGLVKWSLGGRDKQGNEVSYYVPQLSGKYLLSMNFMIGGVSYRDSAFIQLDGSIQEKNQLRWEKIFSPQGTSFQQNSDGDEELHFELVELKNLEAISVICPKAGSTVFNGELFVVCEVNPRIKLDPNTVQIFIASAEVSSEVKVQSHTISAMFTNKIRPDVYDIEVRFRDVNKKLYFKNWSFFIVNRKKKTTEMEVVKQINLNNKSAFSGRISASSKMTQLNGVDAYLRQEPTELHHIRLDGQIHLNKFTIPLKLYATNQESPLLPYRNRFMTGFETKAFKLYLGDFNPYYHQQVLFGQQIRGVHVQYKYHGMEVSYARGEIERSVEGILDTFIRGQGFPPGNLHNDSTYVLEGIYKRKISALNLKFNTIDNTQFNVIFLKSTDDTNSIKYGGYAGQNFVFGASNQVRSRNHIFEADFGVALSVTTDDIKKGTYSKNEIDGLFGTDLPFFPENLNWLIVLNSTSKPLNWNNRPPLAVYGKAKLNILKQHFYFNLDRIGSAYYSFGNPYLQNNRIKYSVEDRFQFWKKKANMTIRYVRFQNNLSDIETITKITQIGSANLNFRYSTKWPQLLVSYRYYLRNEWILNDGSKYKSNGIQHLTAGANYQFITSAVKHHVGLFYNNYLRQFSTSTNPELNTSSINFNLSEEFPYQISFSAYYQSFVQTLDTADLSIQNSFGFRLGWRTENGKIRVSASSNSIQITPSAISSKSSRQLHRLEMTWLIVKDLSFTVETGYGSFEMLGINPQFYEEYWGMIRLNYMIR
ncbi:MAG: hypothetical protein ISR55_01215 [Bacteroidetes bacterium]|nr:hypothetical protein [Bacteroidota bacterium]